MLIGNGNKKRTKIKSGDTAVFFLDRKTLVFCRGRSGPGDNRLRWSNGSDQSIVIESGEKIDAFDAGYIIDIICQTHNLTFEMIEDRSKIKEGEPPTVTYRIKSL